MLDLTQIETILKGFDSSSDAVYYQNREILAQSRVIKQLCASLLQALLLEGNVTSLLNYTTIMFQTGYQYAQSEKLEELIKQ